MSGFDDLLDEQRRWRLLLDAVVSMGAGLSLDELLSRIVEIAADLGEAQYAALGVLAHSPDTRRLRTFVTHGFSDEQRREIGELPSGHGLLGQVIDHPHPIRLHDLGAHPTSFGFPAGHPPMRSFLGVPVRVRKEVFGNLYLTEKTGQRDFTEQDERILVGLAAAAGVAIENAHLDEHARQREHWLAATARTTAQLSGATREDEAYQIVAEQARVTAHAATARILAPASGPEPLLVATSGAPVDRSQNLETEALSALSANGEAAFLDHPGPDRHLVVALPNLRGPGAVLVISAEAPVIDQIDPGLLGAFADQTSLALELARAREDAHRLAALEDRDRIGRDLHDLVIQRLFATGLRLQSTTRLVDSDEVLNRLETCVDELDATILDIRRTIFELATDDVPADIEAEVSRMIERSSATLRFRPILRFVGPVRRQISAELAPDVLAVLGEALSNAMRHADASEVRVDLIADEDDITLSVSDDGRGIPVDATESGLSNMRIRAERRGGRFDIRSRVRAGTTVEWSVPTRKQPES